MIRYDAFYLGKINGYNRHIVIDMCNLELLEIHELYRRIASKNPNYKFSYKDEEKGNPGDLRLINVVYNIKKEDVETKNGVKLDKYYKFNPVGTERFLADKSNCMVLGKLCNKLIVFIPGNNYIDIPLCPDISRIETSIGSVKLVTAEDLYRADKKPINVKIVTAKDKNVYAQSYLGGIYEYFDRALRILRDKKVKAGNIEVAKHIIDKATSIVYSCNRDANWKNILLYMRSLNNLDSSSEKVDKTYYKVYNDLVESLLSEDPETNFLNAEYVKEIIRQVTVSDTTYQKKVKREEYNAFKDNVELNTIFRNLKAFEGGVRSVIRSTRYTVKTSCVGINVSDKDFNSVDGPIGVIDFVFVGPVLEEYQSKIDIDYVSGGIKLVIKLCTVEKDPMTVGKTKTVNLDRNQLGNTDYAKIAGQYAAKYFAEQMNEYSKVSGYTGKH